MPQRRNFNSIETSFANKILAAKKINDTNTHRKTNSKGKCSKRQNKLQVKKSCKQWLHLIIAYWLRPSGKNKNKKTVQFSTVKVLLYGDLFFLHWARAE